MTKRRPSPKIDAAGQGSLFAGHVRAPSPPIALPGSLGCAARISGLVTYVLNYARLELGMGRDEVAARMAELTGERITGGMLNDMSAESHAGHRFPLQWLPALIQATGCYEPLQAVADLVGAVVLIGEDTLYARVGQIDQTIDRLRRERQRLVRMGGQPNA